MQEDVMQADGPRKGSPGQRCAQKRPTKAKSALDLLRQQRREVELDCAVEDVRAIELFAQKRQLAALAAEAQRLAQAAAQLAEKLASDAAEAAAGHRASDEKHTALQRRRLRVMDAMPQRSEPGAPRSPRRERPRRRGRAPRVDPTSGPLPSRRAVQLGSEPAARSSSAATARDPPGCAPASPWPAAWMPSGGDPAAPRRTRGSRR